MQNDAMQKGNLVISSIDNTIKLKMFKYLFE